jgi:3-hydroxyacyl-CoA dehydrogenase/3a,7a,12a-trihydroxy-5b-cholest-24-enoyl-CoA hydratase
MSFKAEELFTQMAAGINKELVEKMKAVFVYRLSRDGKTRIWTVDLKSGNGSIYEGEPKSKSDVEFTMSDEDFSNLVSRKANPQQLFMGGKLKLKGNMALAMKFEQLLKGMEAPKAGSKGGEKKAEKKAEKPAANASAGESKADGFKAAALFNQLSVALKADPSLVDKLKSVFVYRLTRDGKTRVWTIDLKNGKGDIYEGEPKQGKADVEFSMADEDFANLVARKANPQQLFMGGKMKLKGNMALAMKFEQVLKALPQSKL